MNMTKLLILTAVLLLAGCGREVSCPQAFYDEYRDFDACDHTLGCQLSQKQKARLAEERIACKGGDTGAQGGLSP